MDRVMNTGDLEGVGAGEGEGQVGCRGWYLV